MHTAPVPATIDTFDDAMAYLAAQTNYEQRTDWPYTSLTEQLPTYRDFLDSVGAPHRRLRLTVHVAGTKGKGSTCWMLQEALAAQGWRVGMYTSPHLCHVTERIRLAGEAVAPSRFAELLRHLRPAIDAFRAQRRALTFFEILTAMALHAFAEEQLDAVMLEVGLGGRLDSTNAVDADVAVVTSIGWDHTDKLGSTLPAIAGEKAGILKPGTRPLHGIVGTLPREANGQGADAGVSAAFRDRAVARVVHVRMADDGDFAATPSADGRLRFTSRAIPSLTLQPATLSGPLPDRPRAADSNLACALEAMRVLGALSAAAGRQSELDLQAAFDVMATCRLPGRAERVAVRAADGREVAAVVDSAHNAESIAAVAAYCAGHGWRPVVLVGLNRDKLVPGVLRPLAAVASRAVATTVPGTTRAAEASDVAAAWCADGGACHSVEAVADVPSAWQNALAAAADAGEPLLVTGSVYLAGAVLPLARPRSL